MLDNRFNNLVGWDIIKAQCKYILRSLNDVLKYTDIHSCQEISTIYE